jgi:uncharacterized protein (TIGR03032 family)
MPVAAVDLKPETAHMSDSSTSRPSATATAVDFRFTQTPSFVELVRRLGVSVLVSTYQANKLLVARAARDGLSVLVRSFERPMGLAVDAGRLTIGTKNQIWEFRNAPDIAPRIVPSGTHDACYVPRQSHVTGDIGIHELAWVGDELWLVNTRFSCLCTLDRDYSFVPRWRPSFVTDLAAEDRCHLNGLCLVEGKPRFVTALGATNQKDGWRAGKAKGGVVVNISSGDTIATGLCMPHSPRWSDGRLYVLESGTGRLLAFKPDGATDVLVELPGFARGLAFAGRTAFIGLSKIRPTSAMDGVPLAARRGELICGVAAVDLDHGAVLGMLEFQTAVEEVFDVQLMFESRFPEVIGFQKDEVNHTFVVPSAFCSASRV